MTEYRIFETERFQKDLSQPQGASRERIEARLKTRVYPQLRRRPHFGANIKKLRDVQPETWRYRVGDYRFFYMIDEDKKIVFMTAAALRPAAYRNR